MKPSDFIIVLLIVLFCCRFNYLMTRHEVKLLEIDMHYQAQNDSIMIDYLKRDLEMYDRVMDHRDSVLISRVRQIEKQLK